MSFGWRQLEEVYCVVVTDRRISSMIYRFGLVYSQHILWCLHAILSNRYIHMIWAKKSWYEGSNECMGANIKGKEQGTVPWKSIHFEDVINFSLIHTRAGAIYRISISNDSEFKWYNYIDIVMLSKYRYMETTLFYSISANFRSNYTMVATHNIFCFQYFSIFYV